MLNFINGAVSKTISNILCSPINVLKTRFECLGNNVDQKIIESFVRIYK